MASNYQQRDPCVLPNVPAAKLDGPTLQNFFNHLISLIPNIVQDKVDKAPKPTTEIRARHSALGFDLKTVKAVYLAKDLVNSCLKDDGTVLSKKIQAYSYAYMYLTDKSLVPRWYVHKKVISKFGDVITDVQTYQANLKITDDLDMTNKYYADINSPLLDVAEGDTALGNLAYAPSTVLYYNNPALLPSLALVHEKLTQALYLKTYTIYRHHHTTRVDEDWTVPRGVTKIHIAACGGTASGASLNSSDHVGGGGAGYTELDLDVQPGQVLNITVGGGGEWPSGQDRGTHIAGEDTTIDRDGSNILTAEGSTDYHGVNGGTDGVQLGNPSDRFYFGITFKPVQGLNKIGLGQDTRIEIDQYSSGHVDNTGCGGVVYRYGNRQTATIGLVGPEHIGEAISFSTYPHATGPGTGGASYDDEVHSGSAGLVSIYY